MKNIGWFSRLINQQPSPATVRRIAVGTAVALVIMLTGAAFGQNATPAAAPDAQMSVPSGYTVHEAVDLGGRFNDVVGSGAMYDSLLDLHTGPRVLGESFELHALPGKKSTLVDDLTAFGSGFGGDPNNVAKLDFSKGKYYEFSALFRRNRKYFDYDLLGNPNIPGGQSIPIGPSNAPTGAFAWPQVTSSPFLFNTVRRMTDINVTVLPLSTWTFHLAYSKNLREGPSLSPSGYQFAKYNAILEEYERDSTDDFTGSIDWKPVQGTKFSFEEQLTHYKGDSFFTLNPAALILQEADGTKAAINNYDSLTPYGIGACTTTSMGSAYTSSSVYTLLTASTGGAPIINPACAVVTNYLRSQPTRILFPTEVLRMQSASIKNISMNGNVRYTDAHMHLPNYYDSYQGLNGATRSLSYTGNATAMREVLSADFGIAWQMTNRFSLEDQISYSTWHQPGTAVITSGVTIATPTDNTKSVPPSIGNETINNTNLTSTNAASGASTFEGSPNIGTPQPGYMGQLYITNNLTANWDVSSRTTFSFTYRYQDHGIAEGNPHNAPLPLGATTGGSITVNENAGIATIAVRPTANWDLNASVEVSYADNAITPVSPRQLRHYRVHTTYKPKPWATISGTYNDLERHNNTNNNAASVAYEASLATPTSPNSLPYEGPLNHIDYSRIASLSAALYPNERYGFDFNYTFTDVYSATNICFDNGNQNASTTSGAFPGTATLTSGGAPNVCPGVFGRGSTTQLADWFGRDFESAPTQFGSAALTFNPVDKVRYGVGYRISSVNGATFFNDARAVNGSMVSTYQTPYVNFAYKARPDLTLKAEYNFNGYGEGGPSGPQNCSFSTSTTSSVVPCTSLTAQTGLTESPAGETAPRNFHSNAILLGVHYEF